MLICSCTLQVVLDVGAGSGILSFFAQQCGAKRVYAVEASSIASHASRLVAANKVDDVIKVLSGKIEEIQLPEEVITLNCTEHNWTDSTTVFRWT